MKHYSKSELEFLIDEWVVGLNANRNKKIIEDKLINGLTMEQIAEKHGLSITRTKTVIRLFKRKLDALEK